MWEGDKLRISDIHILNVEFPSYYINYICNTYFFNYMTLPFVDGNVWSSSENLAGLRLYYINYDNQIVEAEGGAPIITENDKKLIVEWPLDSEEASFIMQFDEDKSGIKCHSKKKRNLKWFLVLAVKPGVALPCTNITESNI